MLGMARIAWPGSACLLELHSGESQHLLLKFFHVEAPRKPRLGRRSQVFGISWDLPWGVVFARSAVPYKAPYKAPREMQKK